jgi:hypothetical protein
MKKLSKSKGGLFRKKDLFSPFKKEELYEVPLIESFEEPSKKIDSNSPPLYIRMYDYLWNIIFANDNKVDTGLVKKINQGKKNLFEWNTRTEYRFA